MKVYCYLNRQKSNNEKILTAFAEGCKGARLVDDRALRDGADVVSVFYGVDPTTVALYRKLYDSPSGMVLYIDNGYFKSNWHDRKEPYYRITWNAPQHTGIGYSDGERWRALGLEIKPWRTDGSKILVAVQSDWWYEWHNTTAAKWKESTTAKIREHSDRDIIIREKPKTKREQLRASFDDVWCIVTHSSNVAVDGALEGVPCICTGYYAAATTIGSHAIRNVRHPIYSPRRQQWAEVLADNQWTLDEMRSGLAWSTLRRYY